MIDAQNTIDLIKLRFYNEWLYNNHIYPEGESGYHKNLTEQFVKKYIDPLNLKKTSVIYDLGCGPGYFLDEMKSRKYKNLVGVTLSPEDVQLCESKGHTIKQYDLSFIPEQDETVDLIWLRHALEHSPYPIISLIEYNRLLKANGKIYIEVPAPNCDRKHELNLNHYSIMGELQLIGLLQRTGFTVDSFETVSFQLNINGEEVTENFYVIMATKSHSLDIK